MVNAQLRRHSEDVRTHYPPPFVANHPGAYWRQLLPVCCQKHIAPEAAGCVPRSDGHEGVVVNLSDVAVTPQ